MRINYARCLLQALGVTPWWLPPELCRPGIYQLEFCRQGICQLAPFVQRAADEGGPRQWLFPSRRKMQPNDHEFQHRSLLLPNLPQVDPNDRYEAISRAQTSDRTVSFLTYVAETARSFDDWLRVLTRGRWVAVNNDKRRELTLAVSRRSN